MLQIADRLTKIPPYLFMELRKKIAKAKADGVDVISLAIGDPVEPTPDSIIDELCRTARDPENHRYPTDEEKGMFAFRQEVARWYDDPLRRQARSGDGDPGAHRLQGGVPPLRHGPDQPRRRRPDDRSRLSRLPGEHPHGGRDPLQRSDPPGERLPPRLRGDPGGDREKGAGDVPQLPEQPDRRLRDAGVLRPAGRLREGERHRRLLRQPLQRGRLRGPGAAQLPLRRRGEGGGRRAQLPLQALQHDGLADRHGRREPGAHRRDQQGEGEHRLRNLQRRPVRGDPGAPRRDREHRPDARDLRAAAGEGPRDPGQRSASTSIRRRGPSTSGSRRRRG